MLMLCRYWLMLWGLFVTLTTIDDPAHCNKYVKGLRRDMGNAKHQYIYHIEAETKCPSFPRWLFKCIFLNENVWNSIKISLELIPEGPINSMPALVQIMAWRRTGDKTLSEPMMVSLPTHMRHSASMSKSKHKGLHKTYLWLSAYKEPV